MRKKQKNDKTSKMKEANGKLNMKIKYALYTMHNAWIM